MKKTVFFMAVLLSSVLLTSCEIDYTKPKNLAGTEWISYNSGGVAYAKLIFTSVYTVEFWVKEYGEPEYWNGTYSYSIFNNTLRVEYGNEIYFTGTIEKDRIFAVIEEEPATFIKM